MWRSLGVSSFACLLLVLAGCGGSQTGGAAPTPVGSGGSTDSSGATSAGPGLGYVGPAVFQLGVPGRTLPAYASGNMMLTATPALPEGLAFDSDGTITGTPTAVSAPRHYTVSAVNADGSTTADLLLEVNDGPLFYSSPAILRVGSAMAPLVPGGTMYLSGYTVDHALPQGLMLDPATGTISGTPTETSSPSYYTIIGLDAGFDREYGLTLGVVDLSATNPVASGTAFACAHSGGFVGTFAVDMADDSYGLVAVTFLPDGTANVAVNDLSTGSFTESDGLPGLDASMDGGFAISVSTQPNVSVRGSFTGTDSISGTIQRGPIAKSFTAFRLGGSSAAKDRYTGGARNIAVVNISGSTLTGTGYRMSEIGDKFVLLNEEFPIQGTIANGRVTVDSGDVVETYPYTDGQAQLQVGDRLFSDFAILTTGCQLN